MLVPSELLATKSTAAPVPSTVVKSEGEGAILEDETIVKGGGENVEGDDVINLICSLCRSSLSSFIRTSRLYPTRFSSANLK